MVGAVLALNADTPVAKVKEGYTYLRKLLYQTFKPEYNSTKI
jgi:hypothetical protein